MVAGPPPRVNTLRRCQPLLGTFVEITVSASADNDALLDLSLAAFAEIARVQRLMSFHDPESELSRINAAAHLGEVGISTDLHRVLSFALALAETSGGLFDPSIAPGLVRRGLLPDHGACPEGADWRAIHLTSQGVRFDRPLHLDLSGIAKGYAVDLALAVLMETDATVNAGGDLAMSRWQGRDVEIRTPDSGGRATITLPMENRSLATSAAYYLAGDHVILRPGTLEPLARKDSASVFADSCMVADALTKVALLSPDPSPLMNHFGATALIISLEGGLRRI
jgi:thiamine biosynthesis lipoprotein